MQSRVAPARVAMFGLLLHAALVMWADWVAKLDSSALVAASLVLFVVIGGTITGAWFALAREHKHVASFAGAAIWAFGWALNTMYTLCIAWWLITDRLVHIPEFGILPSAATALGGGILAAVTLRRTTALGSFVAGVLALVVFIALSSLGIMLDAELRHGHATLLGRDVTVVVSSLALALVMWLYERGKPPDRVPRARVVS